MNSLLAYILLVAIYVLWDAIMFTYIGKSLYGACYNGITNHYAAAAIYLLYPAAIAILTLDPSSTKKTALKGAILGLTGYGLYHFTNMATLERWPVDTGSDMMKSWPWKITLLDISLGVIITTILSLAHKTMEG